MPEAGLYFGLQSGGSKRDGYAGKPKPSFSAYQKDDRLFLNPAVIELDLLGSGAQRRYRIGDVTFDGANGLLYVLELFADEAKPVIHVWRLL